MSLNKIRLVVTAIFLSLVGACGAAPSKMPSTMRVSVNGVNYSGDTVVFNVEDPAVQKSATGGDRAGPYTQAGSQCCVTLPRIWRPGLKLQINAIVYPVNESDFKQELQRYLKKFTVDVPQYLSDQPTELWVIRSADGEMNIVASNVDPSHESWPGALKGWPEPSLAYKRKDWDIRIRSVQSGIEALSGAFANGTLKHETLLNEWEHRIVNRPSEAKGFSGPDDLIFKAMVTKSYAEALKNRKDELQRLLENQP